MTKHLSDVRILLLQIRDDPRVRKEELDSFLLFSNLRPSQLDVLNVFDTPQFDISALEGYDALYVGGASEASVLEPENYAFLAPAQQLLLDCIEREIPVLASCFGFQLCVCALGGEIIATPDDFEMGTVPIRLTEEAKSDPLMHDVPDGFAAVAVHQLKALQAPPGCVSLAYTDACCHVFRVKDKPFWATQFHPECDRAILIERLTIYAEHYTRDAEHLREVLDATEDTPESNDLLRKFVERIVLHHDHVKH